MTLFLALLADWYFGDPKSLWKRIPHPVVLIGEAIDFLDRRLNRPGLHEEQARQRGLVAAITIVGTSLFAGAVLAFVLAQFWIIGWIVEIAIISVFLAQKSLSDHVGDVAASLRNGGLQPARIAVAKIVGRNPDDLDRSGICRAAIESLAENFSDAVVAPALWYAVLGLPGLIAYKAINTADSMIGHRSEKYLNFGRAVARLDDLVNWPAARLSALLIAIASTVDGGFRRGVKVMDRVMQDASSHRSPNAGWPEAAMAAALAIALGGPRAYGDEIVQEPQLNAASRSKLEPSDINRALTVFRRSCFALIILALIAG